MKRNLYITIIVLSILGILISSYLVYTMNAHTDVVCIVGQESSCNHVLNSTYSKIILDIPNSVLGVVGFTLFLILGFLGFRKNKIKNTLMIFSSLAFIYILYLAYLVFFVINSFCIWCFTVWILVALIFVCSILLRKK